MARFVFFSFAYNDVKNFKVNVVRNSWLLQNKQNTFIDGSIWEKSRSTDETALIKLINSGLNKTSVTCVLIGSLTANRKWINYEIIKSFERGNGIVGIHINRIKGTTGLTARGKNPLDRLGFRVSVDGKKIIFYELKNNRWIEFEQLPRINNKKSNSMHFEDGFSGMISEIFSNSVRSLIPTVGILTTAVQISRNGLAKLPKMWDDSIYKSR